MSEWIKVEDDLPPECLPVLAINHIGEVIVCTLYGGKFVQDTSTAEAYEGNPLEPLVGFTVCQWTRLPELPQ